MKNKQAIICDKWDYRLNNNYKDESHKEVSKRSYLYFVQEKQELVSSKCLATEWLFEDLKNTNYSIREYFAGAGVSTIILKNIIKNKHQKRNRFLQKNHPLEKVIYQEEEYL